MYPAVENQVPEVLLKQQALSRHLDEPLPR